MDGVKDVLRSSSYPEVGRRHLDENIEKPAKTWHIDRMRGGRGRSRGGLAFALAFALASGSVGPVLASPGPLGLSASARDPFYEIETWDRPDGLPQSTVTSMAEGPGGYLWLGTFGGLARFDGVEVEVWDSTRGLSVPRISSVASGPDGRLWLGLERAGMAAIDPRSGEVETIALPPALERGPLERVLWVGDELLVLTRRGAYRRAKGRWEPLLQGTAVLCAARGPGGLYLAGPEGVWRVSSDTEPRLLADAPKILRLASGPDGTLWGLGRRALFAITEAGLEPRLEVAQTFPWHLAAPMVDRRGRLWLGIGDHLYRHPDAHALFRGDPSATGTERWSHIPVDVPIRSLLEDSRENIWVGTGGHGLVRVTLEPFRRVGRAQGLNSRGVGPVLAAREGGWWLGDGCSGVVHVSTDHRVERRHFSTACVHALSLTPSGTLFLGAHSLLELRPDGSELEHPTPEECGELRSVLAESSESVWAGTVAGCLLAGPPDALERIPSPLDRSISTLVSDSSGKIYAGERSRVLVLEGSHARLLTGEDGIPGGAIRVIFPSGDRLWVGSYGGGLALLTPSGYHHFDRERGLRDNFVSFFHEDVRSGFAWLSGNAGASRVALPDFEAVVAGKAERVRALPLRTPESEGASPSGAVGGGSIALATIDGLVLVDPKRIEPAPSPARVAVRGAKLDATPLRPDQHTEVPPGSGQLRVSMTAPRLRWPRLSSFEYRLDEDDWHRVPRGQVDIDNISPGEHVLALRALNEEDTPGPETYLRFRARPFFHQTVLFKGLIGTGVFLVALVGHGLRTRSMQSHLRRLEDEAAERERVESALRERETRYRRVFESSTNAFLVVGPDGRVDDANPTAKALFGDADEELVGQPSRELFDEPVEELGSGEEIECIRLDGSRFFGRVDLRPLVFLDGAPKHLITVVDLTPEREARARERRLEAQIAQSQRVEAIGRLAGGVAHDVNNMLTVVEGQAGLAQSCLEEVDVAGASESLRDILESAQRTSKITKQLLALGRRQPTAPSTVDVRTQLQQMRRLIEQLTPDNVVVHWSWENIPYLVHIDATQLEQLVVNLVINASQAMPTGGALEVSLSHGLGAPEDIEDDGSLEGKEWVRLSFTDTGMGMSEETRERIFDPFFSTKPPATSSGLGLSMVHGLVLDAGGRYFVRSTLGEGARFDFLFPRMVRHEKENASELVGDVGKVGHERILLCEDESPVRRTVTRLLDRAGYEVTAVAHPYDAIAKLRDVDQHFDLILSDVMMPDMNGDELVRLARKMRPRLRALLMSGYTADIVADLDERQDFIEKPFEGPQLLEALRRLLEREPG